MKFALLFIAKFYFQYTSGSDGSSGEEDSADADADSEENHNAEQSAEPHKETVTVPTTMAATVTKTAMPTEQWVGDNASEPRTPNRKTRRLATVGLTPVKKNVPATTTTTTPVTVSAPVAAADEISPLKQGVRLDCPPTPWKEPKPTPTPTPESVVASGSGVGVAKKKKRGRPKTPKAPKSTEVTPQKSDTSMVDGGKEPSKPEQATPTTTTAASADATVVQD